MRFIQTKPQIKIMKFNFYDLYYTVIKNREKQEIVNNEYENKENDSYILFLMTLLTLIFTLDEKMIKR